MASSAQSASGEDGHITAYCSTHKTGPAGESVFCLAPRGNGRTSFHLSENIQAGCIPIYAWDGRAAEALGRGWAGPDCASG